MKLIIGLLIVLGCVAGGYVLSHGKLLAIWQPYELLIICGAAFGAFVMSNPLKVIKASFKGVWLVLKGGLYSKQNYMDLFSLLYGIGSKIRKSGLMSIEEDVDEPRSSDLFSQYPKILNNPRVLNFLTDNLRIISSGSINPYELENLIDIELETYEEELEKPVHAITAVADALPGFGIVAAVLGIVITMQFLGGDPKTLGLHVGAALVGTFLGILLAYGIVAPVANALGFVVKSEMKYLECIKVFLISLSSGTQPQLSVEYARRTVYSELKPSFIELDEHVRKNKQDN